MLNGCHKPSRRKFIYQSALGLGALAAGQSFVGCQGKAAKPPLKLSLSQFALHRAIWGNARVEDYHEWKRNQTENPEANLVGWLKPLDFPQVAREKMGFDAVEYVNTFFFNRAHDDVFLSDLLQRSKDNGIHNVLLMVDDAGYIGDSDSDKRAESVKDHKRWIDCAGALECDSVRVNAHGIGNYEEQKKAVSESLRELADYAAQYGLQVLVENHGGLSSYPAWLLETLEASGLPQVGTMVDFDNFNWSEDRIWGEDTKRFDRYEGVKALMPLAGSVSAKTYAFDANGDETTIDYARMIQIVQESGYTGYTSVEFEGHDLKDLSEEAGIVKTRELIERVW